MYFRDIFGSLFEGEPHVKQSLFEEAKKSNPNKEIKVRNCNNGHIEKKKFKDLTNHSVWRVRGFVAVVIFIILYLKPWEYL